MGVSRAGWLPDRLWTFAPGSSRTAPAVQCLSGTATESHLAAEKMLTRWNMSWARRTSWTQKWRRVASERAIRHRLHVQTPLRHKQQGGSHIINVILSKKVLVLSHYSFNPGEMLGSTFKVTHTQCLMNTWHWSSQLHTAHCDNILHWLPMFIILN